MKRIDKKLLQKYFNGTCSEVEKEMVEAWLASEEYDQSLELDPTIKAQYKEQMWTHISSGMESGTEAAVLPLYKRMTKYAAAACLMIAVFMAGRLSVSEAIAHPTSVEKPSYHLYVKGGNGVEGELPGSSFRVIFDGTVKLYNGSLENQTIHVGDTAFILKSSGIYYLSGSVETPRLSIEDYSTPYNQNAKLEGDFSVLRLDMP